MVKLSQEEGIAVTVGVVVVLTFMTAVIAVGQLGNLTTGSSITDSPQYDTNSYRRAFLDLEVRDLIPGAGAAADVGDTVYVHYVGQLRNGNTFDTSTNNSVPLSVNLGTGQVITGWDLGLLGMRVGGTRRLTIPPELGYGEQIITDSTGDVIIPGNSILIFDIVLLKVQKAGK